MKKYIYLIRHAKSSWKDPELADRERPLNKRGHRNAAEMSARLAHFIKHPDLIISSPAKRSLTTAHYFASELDYPAFDIQVDERLYFCGLKGELKVIKALPETVQSVIIFGHNPDISELLNFLSPEKYEAMPTCTVAKLKLKQLLWKDIDNACAEIKFIEAPKRSLERVA